jgi:hypothetical protein
MMRNKVTNIDLYCQMPQNTNMDEDSHSLSASFVALISIVDVFQNIRVEVEEGVYKNQNHWAGGLCPPFGIVNI